MIEKLKKKYMANCIFATVLLWALAAVFVAITWDDLNVLFQKPLKIEDLKAEDIQKNVKVEGDVYYFMDYYAYQENDDGDTTAMQFMIPVGEAEYMGVNCSGSTMDQAKENMDAYWAYLDGDESAMDNLQPVKISGTIQPLSGEYLKFFNDFVDGIGLSEEDAAVFLPYVINVGDIGDTDTVTLGILGLAALALLITGICMLVSGFSGKNVKKLEKYCEGKGNKEYALQQIEHFYQMQPPVQGIRINEEYFMAVKGTKIYFSQADQILWAYAHVVQHRTNFIPTGKTYSVIVKLDNGKAYDIPMNREANMNEALNYIASNMPYLFIGYDKDFEKLYNKNRMDMRQIVRSRKQEYEVNMTGTAGDMASAPDAEMQKF